MNIISTGAFQSWTPLLWMLIFGVELGEFEVLLYEVGCKTAGTPLSLNGIRIVSYQ